MAKADIDARQSMLEAAKRIMARKGFAAVGLTEVLTAAGVPKGSFYHHFKSKDAFGAAMMRSYFDEYLDNMDRLFAAPDRTGAERLLAYWQDWYETQCADDCQGKCLAVKLGAEVSDLSDAIRLALGEGTDAVVDRIDRMVANGIDDGSLSVDSCSRATAEVLYDVWLGASVMSKIQRSPARLDGAMALTRRLLHLSP